MDEPHFTSNCFGSSRLFRTALLAVMASILSGCLGGGSSDEASDPVVVENAVAYIKRPLLLDDNGEELLAQDLRAPATFRPGARLLMKNNASPGASAIDITSRAFDGADFLNDEGQLRYDVKDLSVSYDGIRLLFAMRAPEDEDADEEDQPKWNIWEYNQESAELRRVIASDVNAEAGHDIAPAYLPDGRIVFSSTRQRTSKAVLLDEGKAQFDALDEEREVPAFVLHVMDSAGENIEQITFNQSHDLDPTVLADGKIVFSRWDNAGQTPENGVNLYQVNPDGTGLSYLYGRHSHDSGGAEDSLQYLKPVETDSRELLVQMRTFETATFGVLPATIDVGQFVESDRTVDDNTSEGGSGQAQVPLVTGLNAFGEQSLNGTYGSASPLFDGTNRYLVSWSPCRLVEVGGDGTITNCTAERLASDAYEPARPVYGLWILDANSGTQLPIERPVEGQQFSDAVLMTSRPLPGFISDFVPTGDAEGLAESGLGILHIRSVYDFDGAAIPAVGVAALADPLQTPPEQRPARFVRIEKPVSIPDEDVREFDNSAFGRSQAQLMREILGYAPIEPDGSVKIAVPANVAFAISVLDAEGRRTTQRHQNWLQLRPGEIIECAGCHTSNSEVPHGRAGAEPEPVNQGASTTGLPFPNSEPALFANMGDTMAETFARVNDIRLLTPDIVFEDVWTDPLATAKAESFSYAYADLTTQAPITPSCAAEWASNCRVVINYEQHIHPLWGVERVVFEDDGVTVADNYTCTGCHTTVDVDTAARLPDAQLDLTDGPSPQDQLIFNAYRELLFNDNEQELLNGALVDVLIDTGEVERDEDGEPILDGAGNEIPIFATVPVPASMNTAGARNSNRFMTPFLEGGLHEGFLTGSELKLIAEWLDIGAQYYNNPFDAPEE